MMNPMVLAWSLGGAFDVDVDVDDDDGTALDLAVV